MQVDAVGAVAGDVDDDVGVDAVREGDGAGAGVVQAADREGNVGRLGVVDVVVGGVVDRHRKSVGRGEVERHGGAGGGGGVVVGDGEAEREAEWADHG